MATEKMFTVCGTSKHDDETKVRFANDAMRVKVLAKNGHTEINLIELPEPMNKLAAAEFIRNLPEFAGAEQQQAISELLDRNTEKPKATRKLKAEKPVDPIVPAVEPASEEDDDKPIGYDALMDVGEALM